MRRREKKKKRLFFLVIWAIFLFLMLTTSSYAWFSVNRLVSISGFDINVNVTGGLEISTNGIDWKTNLTTEDIATSNDKYPNSITQLPAFLEPVSTGGTINDNHLLNMYYGETKVISGRNYYNLSSSISGEENRSGISAGKYIAFDLFLKLDVDMPIFLTKESGTSTTEDMVANGLDNAVRVAFVNEGHTTIGSSSGAIQGLSNATDDDVIIWEPNYDKHTATGVMYAQNLYNITTTMENAERIPYDGIISEFSFNDNIALNRTLATYYPNYFKTVDVDIATKSNFEESQTLFSQGLRGIYKVRIYIWVEGQDVDCEDSASIGNILFNFQFGTLK